MDHILDRAKEFGMKLNPYEGQDRFVEYIEHWPKKSKNNNSGKFLIKLLVMRLNIVKAIC